MLKRILSTLIAVSMSFTALVPAYAEPKLESQPQVVEVSSDTSLQEKIDNLDWYLYSDPDIFLYENTYTYDEMIFYLMENGFTADEAYNYMGPRPIESRGSVLKYQLMSMDTVVIDRLYKLTPQFRVQLEYINGSSSPTRIVSLSKPDISTSTGSKCIFEGDIFYELYNGREFYFDYNGELYKKGTRPWTVEGKIGIGESISVSLKVSNGDGYITDVYESGTYYSAALEP